MWEVVKPLWKRHFTLRQRGARKEITWEANDE